ncbi:hypothetical protein Tco_1360692 [Tanacetum coccineum]
MEDTFPMAYNFDEESCSKLRESHEVRILQESHEKSKKTGQKRTRERKECTRVGCLLARGLGLLASLSDSCASRGEPASSGVAFHPKHTTAIVGLPVTVRDRILRCSPPVVGTTRAGPGLDSER